MPKQKPNIFYPGQAIWDKDFKLYQIINIYSHHKFEVFPVNIKRIKKSMWRIGPSTYVFSLESNKQITVLESTIEPAEPSTSDYTVFLILFWIKKIEYSFYKQLEGNDCSILPLPHRQSYILIKCSELKRDQRVDLLKSEKLIRVKSYLKRKPYLTKFVKRKAKKDKFFSKKFTKYTKEIQGKKGVGNKVLLTNVRTTYNYLLFLGKIKKNIKE